MLGDISLFCRSAAGLSLIQCIEMRYAIDDASNIECDRKKYDLLFVKKEEKDLASKRSLRFILLYILYVVSTPVMLPILFLNMEVMPLALAPTRRSLLSDRSW